MIIVLTSRGEGREALIDPRFGRARYLLAYDDEDDSLQAVDNLAGAEAAHGAGPQTAKRVAELGAGAVITGNGPGGKAAAVLDAYGIQVHVGAGEMTVADALAAYRRGELPTG